MGWGKKKEWKEPKVETPEDRIANVIQAALENVEVEKPSKVEKKIWQNLEKAAAEATEKGTWMEIIECFVENFCTMTIQAYQKEPWFPSLDLTGVIQEGVYDLLPATKFRSVHQQHLHQFLIDKFNESYGRIEQEVHIDNLIWEVCDEISKEDKPLFKKLHKFLMNSWTKTREKVLGEMVKNRRKDPADIADSFAQTWIEDAFFRIWRALGGHEGDMYTVMPEDMLMRIFQDMFQQGALPTPISNIVGPPPKGWRVVNKTIQNAYVEYDPENKDDWKAKSSGGKQWKRKAEGGGDVPWEPVTRESPWAPKKFKSSGAAAPKAKVVVAKEPEEKPQGCLECTSGEECIGSPQDDLYKHVDKSDAKDEGDIYCATCWASFREDNPDLEGEVIPRDTL